MSEDRLERIESTLTKLVSEVGLIKGKLETSTGMCPIHLERMDAVEHVLNGNGSVGIKTRLDRVERVATALTWVVSVAVSAFIIAVVGEFISFTGR